MPAEITEDEADEVPRFVILRVELDRPFERGECLLGETPVIRDLAEVEMNERALRIDAQTRRFSKRR